MHAIGFVQTVSVGAGVICDPHWHLRFVKNLYLFTSGKLNMMIVEFVGRRFDFLDYAAKCGTDCITNIRAPLENGWHWFWRLFVGRLD